MLRKPGIAHQLAVAARLAWRAQARRARGQVEPVASDAEFSASLEPWVSSLPPDALAGHSFHYLPARQPPWFDAGMDLETGDSITVLAAGRVYLSRLLDLWVPPSFQLWCRVGDAGPIFRGTRNTHSFVARQRGRLWLGGYFPGEWADDSGRLSTSPGDYSQASGGMSVLVLRWRPGTEWVQLLRTRAADPACPALVASEAARLAEPAVSPPDRWKYLWYLGPADIYRPLVLDDGRAGIRCHTHGDTGILQREARMPLVPGTRLAWSWRVDQLPIDLAEDTLPSHDYLSIAAEFDDGQDITYYWSSSLPAGTAYRCPLPNWKHKETHVVARSGSADLGRWLDEERDLHADYASLIGGGAREVVRVWLIANSLLTRGHGRCEYARISLSSRGRSVQAL